MKRLRLLPMLLLLCGTLHAQREVAMPAYVPPSPVDAVVAGDRLPRTVTCQDHIRVYVKGQANEVQVYGDCSLVRVEGDRNFVWVDHGTQVAVVGSNNVIYIRASSTRVSSQGSGNRFELRR